MIAIECSDVGVKFNRARQAYLARKKFSWRLAQEKESFWALNNLELKLKSGDVLGVIGANGAGKSTLLKVLVGVLPPDQGYIQVNGKVSALLSVNAGFMPHLSGRDNIMLSAMYNGMGQKEARRKINAIIEFSELETFIDTPVRHYSSGMKARLGFAVVTHVTPEILIIDEALSAGDHSFRQKAKHKMAELIAKARAIVIVSHSMSFVKQNCTRVIWLEQGRIKADGCTEQVISQYMKSATRSSGNNTHLFKD